MMALGFWTLLILICILGLGNGLLLMSYLVLKAARRLDQWGREWNRWQCKAGAIINGMCVRAHEAAGEQSNAR